MGKVFSRFTVTVKRTQVSPEHLIPEKNVHHQKTEYFTRNNTTDIFQSEKHLSSEQGSSELVHGKDYKMISKNTERNRKLVTQKQKDEIKFMEIEFKNLENDRDTVCDFSYREDGEENSKTDWFSDVSKSVKNEGIIMSNIKDDKISRTLQGLSYSKSDPLWAEKRNEFSVSQCYSPPNKYMFPTQNNHCEKQSYRGDSSDDDNDPSLIPNDHELKFHQVTSHETLKGVTEDRYSTRGTFGSKGGSFENREDSNYSSNDTLSETLSEVFKVVKCDDIKEDFQMFCPERATTPLTPVSLETLNCCELDKRQCVRSFIQACEPSEMSLAPESLPSTTSSCNEAHEHDNCKDFIRFKPPKHYWVHCKHEKAPWSDSAPTESCIVERLDTFFERDEDENSWPSRLSYNDSKNRLTLCSLSTINEESSDDDKTQEYR